MGKKGHKAQKKVQGAKAKSILKCKRAIKSQVKAAKNKKTETKAVKSNLKKVRAELGM